MQSTGLQPSQKFGGRSARQVGCSISSRYKFCKFRSEGLFSSGWGWTKFQAEISSSKFEFSREGDFEAGEADSTINRCVFISRDQVNISLVKKCKTVDVPAVNSAIGNVQKALQKYVGFSGMDSEYCDRIGELMDRAQAWCLDIEELYNKAEVYSINNSKGDAADVGVFSVNSQVTVFEFLESM